MPVKGVSWFVTCMVLYSFAFYTLTAAWFRPLQLILHTDRSFELFPTLSDFSLRILVTETIPADPR